MRCNRPTVSTFTTPVNDDEDECTQPIANPSATEHKRTLVAGFWPAYSDGSDVANVAPARRDVAVRRLNVTPVTGALYYIYLYRKCGDSI